MEREDVEIETVYTDNELCRHEGKWFQRIGSGGVMRREYSCLVDVFLHVPSILYIYSSRNLGTDRNHLRIRQLNIITKGILNCPRRLAGFWIGPVKTMNGVVVCIFTAEWK